MKKEINPGLSFGLTSGVITTLGLMIGLYSGTNSRLVVVGGILTIAFADAFSDSLGIHISKESEKGTRKKELWTTTFSSFTAKLIISLTFIIPVILFKLNLAILISIIWGLFVMSILSYKVAKIRRYNPLKVIGEHLIIAVIVIFLSRSIGNFAATFFGRI